MLLLIEKHNWYNNIISVIVDGRDHIARIKEFLIDKNKQLRCICEITISHKPSKHIRINPLIIFALNPYLPNLTITFDNEINHAYIVIIQLYFRYMILLKHANGKLFSKSLLESNRAVRNKTSESSKSFSHAPE